MNCNDCKVTFSKEVKIRFDPFMQMVCANCDIKIRNKIREFRKGTK